MKKVIDNFSFQAGIYKKYRPVYPMGLMRDIYKHCTGFDLAWDAGTGNGQVALELARHFRAVYATDVSADQIQKADKKENIQYAVERAETSTLRDESVDLITVAQALHWLDIDAFRTEAYRVLAPLGLLAVWGYSLIRVNDEVDPLIDDFYTRVLGSYWDPERSHVDTQYRSLDLGIKEIALTGAHSIVAHWGITQFLGYLRSWSAVRKYTLANKANPVDAWQENFSKAWGPESRTVTFPIFVRMGRKFA